VARCAFCWLRIIPGTSSWRSNSSEKHGHVVSSAANGKEAVEAIAAGSEFGLILLDVQMPE
jgi:CheY-like chemotaxis protein